jgi:hypothetical protein
MQKSVNYISNLIDSFTTFFINNDSEMKNTSKSEKIKIKIKKLNKKTKNNKSRKNKTRKSKTKKKINKNTSSSSWETISDDNKKYKKIPSYKDFTNYKSDSDESGYKIGDFISKKI